MGYKRYNELTDKEILKCTKEDIEKLIELECAIEGVKIVDKPEEIVKPDIERNMQVFKVMGVLVRTREEAEIIAKAVQQVETYKVHYDYEINYNDRYLEKDSEGVDCSIIVENYPDKKSLDEVKEKLKRYDKEKKLYDDLKAEYDSARDKRLNIADIIWKHIDKVQSAERERIRMVEEYKKYVILANSEEIAKRFLCNAYGKEKVEERMGTDYIPEGYEPLVKKDEEGSED